MTAYTALEYRRAVKTTLSGFTKYVLMSAVAGRRLCTSGFVLDVMFLHN